ncbi:MAG: DUF2199 domain-containing protein [Chitinophagaceae bacterium]|nr:DUF2199 domain-containing protein [Chitinophagaceae bacterium]
MEESYTYLCSKCGREHAGWPALAYLAPVLYDNLSEEEKQEIGELDSDFCMIRHEDQTDRFIRCTLTQKVTDHCENLEYGLWVYKRSAFFGKEFIGSGIPCRTIPGACLLQSR